jgi:hypothetical protein
MRTERFIDLLAQDRLADPRRLKRAMTAAVLAGIASAAGPFFLAIGVRPDIDQVADTSPFLFKFLVTLSLAATATGLLLRLARPGSPTQPWRFALAIPAVLLAIAVLVEMLATPATEWWADLVGSRARTCLALIPLLGAAPLLCFLVALRQGAPTRPGLTGAVAGLAAGGIAATFYAANCTDDASLFVATWYPLATGIVSITGWAIGRRILKW